MSNEETVDELVDKAIDEALSRAGKDSEEIKKRKPRPFRYITDKEEMKAELNSEDTPVSIMKESPRAKIVDEQLAVLGLGDLDTIENLLKRHEASRKFKEK